MKVLLLGSGGREHALYWKLRQSQRVSDVRAFPGNGGFPEDSLIAGLDLSDLTGLRRHVERERYDLVVVGPEDPLVNGISDELSSVCPVFGPGAAAARLEGSKAFSKDFMERHGIPTAASRVFEGINPALEYLEGLEPPIVIKADGLAQGKGVVVALDRHEAEQALRDRLERDRFGAAGRRVVVEEFLPGEEASVFAICDGARALPMLASQDHKRAFDGDQGPNTGGMGAYLPVPMMDASVMRTVQEQVLDRAVAGMQADGHEYRGLLYAGLMIHQGRVRVVEFNVRFGDPETQALLPLLNEDLAELAKTAASGRFQADRSLNFHPGAALVIVLAAEGYPGSYKKGIELKNIDSTESDIIFFHAVTRREGGRILSTGGRILGLTALGSGLRPARERAYARLEKVVAPGTFYRRDIGVKALR